MSSTRNVLAQELENYFGADAVFVSGNIFQVDATLENVIEALSTTGWYAQSPHIQRGRNEVWVIMEKKEYDGWGKG